MSVDRMLAEWQWRLQGHHPHPEPSWWQWRLGNLISSVRYWTWRARGGK